MSMDEAWAAFDTAAEYDERRVKAEAAGDDKKAGMLGRVADKHLDKAVELEKLALT